jgi:hypothetical protein
VKSRQEWTSADGLETEPRITESCDGVPQHARSRKSDGMLRIKVIDDTAVAHLMYVRSRFSVTKTFQVKRTPLTAERFQPSGLPFTWRELAAVTSIVRIVYANKLF